MLGSTLLGGESSKLEVFLPEKLNGSSEPILSIFVVYLNEKPISMVPSVLALDEENSTCPIVIGYAFQHLKP